MMEKPSSKKDGEATQRLATVEVVVHSRLDSQREDVVLPEPRGGAGLVT